MAAKTEFIPPTIEEVIEYITEKKKKEEWPKKFCEYYGEKFWMYYKSVGWVISGKAKMKDWKAAFCNQWQNLRFPEDLEMLNKYKPPKRFSNASAPVYVGDVKVVEEKSNDTVGYMDEVLEDYIKHPAMIPRERLASCYDWLKEKKLIRISKEQKDAAIQIGDVNKGKALIVQFVFDMMATNLLTFNKVVYAR